MASRATTIQEDANIARHLQRSPPRRPSSLPDAIIRTTHTHLTAWSR